MNKADPSFSLSRNELVNTDLSQRIAVLTVKLKILLDAPSFHIAEVLKTKLKNAAVEGVYAISLPDSTQNIVYVGRTKSKLILGRLQDHLFSGTSSDLGGMIKRFSSFPQSGGTYKVRWLEIAELRERQLLEHFAIAAIDPPFNQC